MTRALLSVVGALVAALLGTAPAVASSVPASVGADGRVSIAIIAPITVPVTTSGLLSATQLTRFTGTSGVLTQELDSVASVPGQPIVLAIDPRIIASIRVLGDAAPASATQWLTRLAALPNETFPLLYADADPVLIGQTGASADLSPLDFGFAIDDSHFGSPSPTPSPSASATTAPGSRPALPQTAADVLQWNWRYQKIVWPAADTVTAADLPRLAAAGYQTVVVDDRNASGPGGHVSFTNDGAPQNLTGLVADSALSAAASSVADSGSSGADTGVAGLTAATQAVAADSRGATRVVTLDRSATASLRFLPAAIQTMEAAGATTVPLQSVLATSTQNSALVDKPESSERTAVVPGILAAIAAESAFSSVAVDAVDVTAPRRLALLAVLSTGWVGDTGWATAVQGFLEQSTKLRAGVSLAASSATGLGADPPLPVVVRNDLQVPIKVYVVARSLSPNLSVVRRRTEVTVQPESTQTTRIATQSVANGAARIELSLATTTGVPVGDQRIIAIDVQAGWETVGTLVAVVLVLGVFGFGVTRNILRRRAARRAPPSSSDPDAAG